MLILAIIIFVFTLSLLVLVHEYGHYSFARKNGVKVEEFAFGYPPRAIGWYKSSKTGKWRYFFGNNDKHRDDIEDTIYSLNWIPFGGFCKMKGEEDEVKANDSFSVKKPWVRAKILVAGVLYNFLLAWVLMTLWFWIVPKNVPNQVIIVDVDKGSLAKSVDIKANDFVEKINDIPIKNIEVLQNTVKANAGKVVSITIKRYGQDIIKEVMIPPDKDAPLGVSLIETGSDNIPNISWWKAPYYALLEVWNVIAMSAQYLWTFILAVFGKAHVSTEGVSGPVGVFSFLYQIIYLGVAYVVRFMALMSVAVGFFNILPFPALDGGHLLFVILEAVKGKKVVKQEVESIIHWVGFMLLLVLFVIITYNDVSKLITR